MSIHTADAGHLGGVAWTSSRAAGSKLFLPLATATLDALTLPERLSTLDVACGPGIIPKLLAKRVSEPCRIVGTDLNPEMVEAAERAMPSSPHAVEWLASDVTNLPFDDGEFDIAFCQQGLQFFPDKPAALTEIRRVLAPTQPSVSGGL